MGDWGEGHSCQGNGLGKATELGPSPSQRACGTQCKVSDPSQRDRCSPSPDLGQRDGGRRGGWPCLCHQL